MIKDNLNMLILLCFCLLYPINVYSENIPERIYKDFNKNNFSRQETEQIISCLKKSIIIIQSYISDIASKYVRYSERKRYRNKILQYFESPNTIIEVTNVHLHNEPPKRVPIKGYLNRLMDIKYTSVSVYFSEKYKFSKLYKNSNEKYEIGVSVWQFFVARNDDIIVYSDQTLKQTFFTLYKGQFNEYNIKINEIKAIETKPFRISTDY